jgi:hypothetical protein
MENMDFSVNVAARWIASLRWLHHRDPPKIAGTFTMGALVRTQANPWHMHAAYRGFNSEEFGTDFVSAFVAAYNAARALEVVTAQAAAIPQSPAVACADRTFTLMPNQWMSLRVVPGMNQFVTISAQSPGVRAYVYEISSESPSYPGHFRGAFVRPDLGSTTFRIGGGDMLTANIVLHESSTATRPVTVTQHCVPEDGVPDLWLGTSG